jgi:ATP-dependent Lhr-like helicase
LGSSSYLRVLRVLWSEILVAKIWRKSYNSKMSSEIPGALGWAHPLVEEWFVRRFGTPTEPQEQGWPHILAGRATLISAPTGSGKTLAAFLACIDRLVRQALSGDLRDRTQVLYVSPLKALGNDIQKNLEIPLGEILQLAGERGLLMPEIRTAVRTGDTLMHERRAMLRRPPHILVTTPESLYILLTAQKSREILREVETVIVDEIHAVADDKRGSHLTLSLERLDALTGKPPVRIGLSATQKPIEEIAHFLTGNGRPDPAIVNIGHKRQMDVAIEVPASELGPVASNDMWDEIYDRVAELVRQHRSTLVFVNTRRLAERVAHHLAERLGEDAVAAHHGSLARKLRLTAERKLKNGEVRVLVATASLELGIDVGTVDLVCHISSPRSIAVTLQRIGRAGHWRGAVPKGRIFVTTRDELVECAALVRSIRHGDLDRIIIPEAPLDVLAQQIVAACTAEEWKEEDLYALARRAYPYRELSRPDFEALLEMLSEGIAARRGRYGAYLHRDRVNGRLRARRGARLAAITSGGAIPDNSLYTVIAEPEGAVVGTVDEDFAVESMAGEIMLLGNSSWRIRKIEASGRMLVEDAHGAPPSIPFWRGEAPARTDELSLQVSDLRAELSRMLPNTRPGFLDHASPEVSAAIEWLGAECGLDQSGSQQVIQYLVEGRAVLGDVPTQQTIIAERFFDEGGGMQLILHAPFGARITKAWGLALRKRFCRSFNFELQAAATDNGLNIALAEQHSFPLADVFQFLHAETVQPVLEQAVLTGSPIFGTRWRWDAERALALIRFQRGKKVPPQIQRMRSDDLLASVFPDVAACQENIVGDIQLPDHPLVREVMKDVLSEAMNLEGLKRVLRGIDDGSIRCLAVDTPVPSQFSHEILNANPYAYLDDAPLEERRARAVEMRRTLPESVLEEVGKLDPAAIAEVREQAWPEVRDPDELHDVLQTLIALPEARASLSPEWKEYFERLRGENRATIATVSSPTQAKTGLEWATRTFWVAAERASAFRAIYPQAEFADALPSVPGEIPSADDALLAMATGWAQHSGPTSASELGETLALPASEIEKALLRLEASGAILRGRFTLPADSDQTEWCDRRLLARIHRLTVATLRKQIEPVTAAQYMRWLLRWQHVAPGSQVVGERGAIEVLRQLQGFEIPAVAWERQILARRIASYDPQVLDQLCMTGVVGWGRLSPHPATLDDSAAGGRRVVPTSVAPITFFLREEADWMQPLHTPDGGLRGLSPGAREVAQFLKTRGASFFADIVRGTGKLKAEVETALWDLVAAGVITADGFDNLRALIDPKRRAGHGSGRTSRPRHSSGRWSLLYTGEPAERNRAVEAACWMLLHRYGVVFRDLLARESVAPRWRELQLGFRRLEARGEIRGGRFISGFSGEQFALPVAVESLRALRRVAPAGETITLSAADPLNLVGIVVPGERVPAISGRLVAYRDGVAVEPDAHALAAIG